MDTTISPMLHTRGILATVRSISRLKQGPAHRAGFTLRLVLDRTNDNRIYRLDYSSTLRAGCWIIIDVLRKEAWISRVREDKWHDIDAVWYDLMVDTTLVDHLIGQLASAGYTFLPGSSGL